MEFLPTAILAAAADSDVPIPGSIRNNRYFIESVRLTNLAQRAFEDGDYDLSAQYSADAVRNAELSDEYVKLQLKIKEVNDAIASAKSRLDWAASGPVNARQRYPAEYATAESAYNEAVGYRGAEQWDDAIAAAARVISALAYVTETPPAPPPPPPAPSEYPLPAQYTVRPWSVSKDCLWNIAGRAWAYGDPTKWKLLYNANKAKLPQPDNPDLIHPGMILDIPSIKGETREGMWDAARSYVPLP
jgi:nucleoid-associated protein YgaU